MCLVQANALCCIVLHCVALCCIVLHCVVALCCIVLHCVALCCIVLHCVALCCIVLHCVVALCCIVSHCVALCCIVLHCVALCCIVLSHCVALCCIVLHCVALCCIVLQNESGGGGGVQDSITNRGILPSTQKLLLVSLPHPHANRPHPIPCNHPPTGGRETGKQRLSRSNHEEHHLFISRYVCVFGVCLCVHIHYCSHCM